MRLCALNINESIRVHPLVSRHGLAPILHVLQHRLPQLLLAEIQGLLVLANHPDLRAGGYVRGPEIILVKPLLDGALDLASQDIGAQPRLLAHGPRKPDAVDGLERRDHGADGLEAAGDVRFRLAEGRHDGLGKLKEERFTLFCALAFVPKR